MEIIGLDLHKRESQLSSASACRSVQRLATFPRPRFNFLSRNCVFTIQPARFR